jgi:hypothetical protein
MQEERERRSQKTSNSERSDNTVAKTRCDAGRKREAEPENVKQRKERQHGGKDPMQEERERRSQKTSNSESPQTNNLQIIAF